MTIINEKKAGDIIEKTLSIKKDVNKIHTYMIWKKIMPFFIIVVAICSTLLARITIHTYKENILSIFGKDNVLIYDKLLIGLVGFLIIIACSIVYIFFHEVLHIVLDLKNWKNIYIVINFPSTISVLNNKWNTKLWELISMALPFVVFTILSTIIFLCTKNLIIFLWINLLNIAYSSSDIVAFCVIYFKIPRNSLILGNYFCNQQ